MVSKVQSKLKQQITIYFRFNNDASAKKNIVLPSKIKINNLLHNKHYFLIFQTEFHIRIKQ